MSTLTQQQYTCQFRERHRSLLCGQPAGWLHLGRGNMRCAEHHDDRCIEVRATPTHHLLRVLHQLVEECYCAAEETPNGQWDEGPDMTSVYECLDGSLIILDALKERGLWQQT